MYDRDLSEHAMKLHFPIERNMYQSPDIEIKTRYYFFRSLRVCQNRHILKETIEILLLIIPLTEAIFICKIPTVKV